MEIMNKELFNRALDQAVYEKIQEYQDFYLLMKNCDGIHPLDYLGSLRRLYRSRKIKKSVYRKILQSAHMKGFTPGEDSADVLLVPHLLDYDWRFSRHAIKHLCQKIRGDMPREGGTVVFIGTPSLWRFCVLNLPEKYSLVLVDINAKKHMEGLEKDNISVIEIDINKKPGYLKKISADIIVMDPPWYLNYYLLFFDRANEMARIDTLIYCVMPPKFTRVTAEQEKEKLLKTLWEKYGMEKKTYRSSDVSYHTPPYEINVLKAHGIECLPPHWRVGDLLVVKKTAIGSGNTEDLTVYQEPWDEYSINSIRIKVRHSDTPISTYSIHLKELYKNNVYPSVKRSFNGKKSINVWTSGNRVFWCDNVPLLSFILSNWGRVWYKDEISEEERLSIGAVQTVLAEVVSVEMKEYGMKWRLR